MGVHLLKEAVASMLVVGFGERKDEVDLQEYEEGDQKHLFWDPR